MPLMMKTFNPDAVDDETDEAAGAPAGLDDETNENEEEDENEYEYEYEYEY